MATSAVREELVEVYTGMATHASLHSATPGSTGAGEIVAVARQPLVWTLGAVDGQATTASVTFEVPAETDVTHIGLWSALTGGTFIDSVVCLTSFSTAGSYTMTLNYAQS